MSLYTILLKIVSQPTNYYDIDNLLQLMNRLAFDPNKKIIEEWREIYLTEPIMDSFETIIDRAHMYLEVIKNYKRKRQKQKKRLVRSRPSLCQDIEEDPTAVQVQNISHQAYIQIIEEWIGNINILKAKLAEESSAKQINKSDKYSESRDEAVSKAELESKLSTCETHLQQITVHSIKFYNNFLSQQFVLVEDFIKMKLAEVGAKYGKMESYLKSVNMRDFDLSTIRIIYQNIYIQSQYLRKVTEETKNIFQRHSSEKQYSSEYYEINQVRQKYTSRIQTMQQSISQLKQKLRVVYFQHFKKKKASKIRDHSKLEQHIREQIAVNKQEYQKANSNDHFANGFIAAFLLCMLVAIIIFRQVNLNSLQSDNNYLRDFKIWRGASYLIYFNWIFGIVLFFLDKFKINYRLIHIQDNTFIPKYSRFLLTASILSAIYLTLFLVYILYKLNIINGNGGIQNMGYYMWIINIVFLLNPFKVLNYEGRKYFLILIYKFFMTLFCPMNMNIFFVAIIVASFVQPFSDFAFTVCKIAYSWQANERDCLLQTKNATFVFTLTYLFYRCVQSIRSHIQFGDTCYSRPLIGITAVLFAANTVLSSYFYNIQLSNELFAYWLASAVMSTIAGIQADFRADWGIISFDKEDCILRKYKLFERKVYYIVGVIDIILNIGWILTISNDLSNSFGLNPVYFLMILAYIELARKGLWIFFRIEDDHSTNIGNLRALIDDSHLYTQIESQKNKLIQLQNSKTKQSLDQSKFNLLDYAEIKINIRKSQNKRDESNYKLKEEGEPTQTLKKLSDIQEQVIKKKINIVSIRTLVKQLEDYLSVIHEIYQQFQWEDQY